MIVNFKNYTLTYEELNERLTLVSVEPKFENEDFAEFSLKILSSLNLQIRLK